MESVTTGVENLSRKVMVDKVKQQRCGGALPRYQRVPEDAPGMVLTARDVALLEDIWRFGLLTTTQLETLRGAATEASLCFVSRLTLTRRLKLLFHHRYVRRIPRPLAQGSQEPVYVLDREGARTLSLKHGDVTARMPSRLPKAAALDHLLAIVQVRIALTAASARTSGEDNSAGNGIELVEWLPGSRVRFQVALEGIGQRRRNVALIPDAGLIVRIQKLHNQAQHGQTQRHYAFLEVDRGTESQHVLTEKARTYIAYWQSHGFARDFSVPEQMGFWVLFVAPTPKRADNLLKAVGRVAGPRLIFRVALEQEMTPQHITGKVWRDGEAGRLCRFWQLPQG